MGRLTLIVGLLALGIGPAVAIDPVTLAAAEGYKGGKVISGEDVGVFMREGERWCYMETAGSCAWSEIYLSVDADGARYETSGRWDSETETSNLGLGEFSEAGLLCDTNTVFIDSLRARRTLDGSEIGGRALDAMRTQWAAQIAENQEQAVLCYDYLMVAIDAEAETIALTQRVWRADATDPAEDAVVTIHFNAETAAGLGIAL